MSFRLSALLFSFCVAVLTAPMSNVFAQEQPAVPGIKPAVISDEMSEEELLKTFSTLLVYNQMAQMKNQLENDGFKIDGDAAIEATKKVFAGEEVGVPQAKIVAVMSEMQKRVMAARAEKQKELQAQREKMMEEMKVLAAKNKATGDAYLAENAKKEGVKTLDGGVQYEVLVEGKGATPEPTDKIKINYHGTFIDGTVFDSTIEEIRGKTPAPYTSSASGFVDGFNTAVQAMPVGSKWKVSIPSDQAYKMGRPGAMEPNKTLIFEVELLEIIAENPAPAAPAGSASSSSAGSSSK